MKINRVNLALTKLKKQCELGNLAKLFYDVGTNELWCSVENMETDALVDVTELIPTNPEWMASLYVYGMTRRLIEEVVKFINKKENENYGMESN